MKEALAIQPQEIQIPTFFKARERLGQKALTALGIVAAIGLITACQDGQAQNPNLNKPPATSATKAPEQLIISTIVPTETPKPKVISLESYLEIDQANPSVETIKLLFPEEIIHGKSPLIPKGDTLSVSLKFKNDTRINQLSLSLSDLLNTKNNFSMGMSAVNEHDTASIASAISIFQRIAEFKISDTDQKIINKILFSTVRDSNNDLVIKLSLPNESITIIDNDGSHLVNPAERFATGKLGIGIKRGIGSKLDLAVENSKITNNKDKLVATAERFDINLSRIKVVSNTAQPNIIIPTVTPRPTPTPTNTPEPTRTPMPTPMPTPTLAPTPQPTPIPTQVLISERKIGTERKFTECFNNSPPTKRASIEFETTGIEIDHVKFKGEEKYLKTEIKVPKTKKEIEEETEKAKKKAKKEGKDPNTIVIDPEKIVSEGTEFDVDQNSICAKLKVKFRFGSDRDCYSKVNFNFVNRESEFNGRILESATIFQNSCIDGVVKGTFEPSRYEYNQATNTVTAFARIHNPDQDTPQETKVKLVKPCSFLDAAGREIVDYDTNKPIPLNEPIKIPPNTIVWLKIISKMPFEIPPTFPLECTVELDRELEK